ncbi:MAG: 16S rRNA (cytosine(1402)-N(4))-methyltransferase RsmH [Gammaproteobacteria bacterium]|jgi:16S rRNA (cytosine1402-N4)-methyltransferase|nr:16S rRNA (cytosine(1402)-N(4))-methyltransferase RsmH [Gammaproteobacteria bacterium]
MQDLHVPVLLEEVLEHLQVRADGCYVDGTFGRGGHARKILEQLGPDGRLLVIDKDMEAVRAAEDLAKTDPRVITEHAGFGGLQEILMHHGIFGQVDGILLDLGVSSPQLDTPERGFSFQADGPLDMRMDTTALQTAEAWLNSADFGDIARVISRYGEDKNSRRIAQAICDAREEQRVTTTAELAAIIEKAVPRYGKGKHPATKTFQAIRIYLNDELGELRAALDSVIEALNSGARLCIISFHSLEDRMVKRFMRDNARVDPALSRMPIIPESARPVLQLVKGAIKASDAELAVNPRARSAVLRVAEVL